ncbi:protein EXPORTIN 1A-like [Miscanthus floridulus]|uniref:protein EXPORTIN 1A-like n=1 Tax=Miscanthus floridulus TaxID=154761 RepID=UPI003457ECB0
MAARDPCSAGGGTSVLPLDDDGEVTSARSAVDLDRPLARPLSAADLRLHHGLGLASAKEALDLRRLKFCSLLRAIGTDCFQALIQLSSPQLKLVIDSINWAFRRTERNIVETGLSLLLDIFKKFQASGFQNQFYKTYFFTIEQEIFAVLTDTFHKPGFKLHVLVLQHLFCVVDGLTEPLWDASSVAYQYTDSAMFVRDYTIKLLGTSFPNMTVTQVTKFVDGLLSSKHDLPSFKNHIRGFLVQSKEFSAQDNKDLYAEEAAAQREWERQRMLAIPALIAPSELQDEMVDS